MGSHVNKVYSDIFFYIEHSSGSAGVRREGVDLNSRVKSSTRYQTREGAYNDITKNYINLCENY